MTAKHMNTPIHSIVSFIESRAVVKRDAKGLSKEASVSFADLFDGDKTKTFRLPGTKGQLAQKIIDRMADESINGQRDDGDWFAELRRRISMKIEGAVTA
jgi:hypothetical protein